MHTRPTAEPRVSRLGMLDALRFVAAFAVVAFHFTSKDSPAWDGPVPTEVAGVGAWTLYGALGVPLFFVISGFVLLMTAWDRTIPHFVASRVGRLFPAYWVAVGVSGVLLLGVWPEGASFWGWEISKAQGALNLTMVQGAYGVTNLDGAFWTLWYEAKFYLLVAILMAIGITRQRVIAFAMLWPIVGAMAEESGQEFIASFLMPNFAPFFAGGMLLYLIHRDGHDLGTWLLVGTQTVLGVNFAVPHYFTLSDETIGNPSKALIAVVIVACFGAVAAVTVTPLSRVNAGWMFTLGLLTYPLYLIHENLGWFAIDLLHRRLGAWPAIGVAAAVALVAATLIHHLVERPLGGRLRAAVLQTLERTAQPQPDAGVVAPPTLPPSAPVVVHVPARPERPIAQQIRRGLIPSQHSPRPVTVRGDARADDYRRPASAAARN